MNRKKKHPNYMNGINYLKNIDGTDSVLNGQQAWYQQLIRRPEYYLNIPD